MGAQNWGSAFLPNTHQGCPIGNASIEPSDAMLGHIANNVDSISQQRVQLNFIKSLNNRQNRGTIQPELEQRIKDFEMAFRMQTSMPLVQDLTGESEVTKGFTGWISQFQKILEPNV